MPLPPELVSEVMRFLSEEWRISPPELTLATRLEEDLGITGDDAEELLEDFAKRFSVDLTGMEFSRHFGPEGCNPLFMFLLPKVYCQDHGKYPVTVEHLVRVAQIQRWFDPPRVR